MISFMKLRPLLALAPLLASAFYCVSCDLGTVSGQSPTDSTTTKAGYATLTIVNAIEHDPGTFTFNLYYPNSTLIDNSTPVQKLGDIAEGATRTFQIPKGTWKLGYVFESIAEPIRDLANTGTGWPKLTFADSGKYDLLLFTKDEENRNYITHNIPEGP
jgi:hypothetical protein